jgi:hypothetical protein
MGWRRVGVAGSAPNSPLYPSSPRSTLSAPSSGRHSNLLRSPFAADRPAAAAAAAATAAAATATAAAAPGAAAAVSALSGVESADIATAAAAAAAAATTVAAVEVATAAAIAAGREGDVAVPDELSPIPGLPVRPEPGGLSGPLATLQLVIHRCVCLVCYLTGHGHSAPYMFHIAALLQYIPHVTVRCSQEIAAVSQNNSFSSSCLLSRPDSFASCVLLTRVTGSSLFLSPLRGGGW